MLVRPLCGSGDAGCGAGRRLAALPGGRCPARSRPPGPRRRGAVGRALAADPSGSAQIRPGACLPGVLRGGADQAPAVYRGAWHRGAWRQLWLAADQDRRDPGHGGIDAGGVDVGDAEPLGGDAHGARLCASGVTTTRCCCSFGPQRDGNTFVPFRRYKTSNSLLLLPSSGFVGIERATRTSRDKGRRSRWTTTPTTCGRQPWGRRWFLPWSSMRTSP